MTARSRAGDADVDDERFTFDAADTTVSGIWTPAAGPVAAAALAHGAGAGMDHPFMAGAAAGLSEAGVLVLRFNFPYVEARRRIPDRAPRLLETWSAAMAQLRTRAGGLPMVAGGKSMGGRMASMMAAAEGRTFAASALVFFGYPLHPPGGTDRLRDAHLPRITVPMLFIQGTRDALARFDLIEGVVRRLAPLARLHGVQGGDHSFKVAGTRRPDYQIGRTLGVIAAEYLREVLAA